MTEANKEDIILVANFMGYFVQSKNGKSYLYSNEPPSVLKHHMDWNLQIEVWSKVIWNLRNKFLLKLFTEKEYQQFLDSFETAIFCNDKEKGFKVLVKAIKKNYQLHV